MDHGWDLDVGIIIICYRQQCWISVDVVVIRCGGSPCNYNRLRVIVLEGDTITPCRFNAISLWKKKHSIIIKILATVSNSALWTPHIHPRVLL